MPVIIITMRLPSDLPFLPTSSADACTFRILEPSLQIVAKALFGFGEMTGRLPVSIPGLVEKEK